MGDVAVGIVVFAEGIVVSAKGVVVLSIGLFSKHIGHVVFVASRSAARSEGHLK
jgi:hypothetical protein